MAIVSTELTKVFSRINKTNTKSVIQNKLPVSIIKLVVSFLNISELVKFGNTARFANLLFQEDIVAKGLLSAVFNAEPAKVDKFFKQSNAKIEAVLIKSSYREGYYSKRLNKFIYFRNWKNVSPLQAAGLCLDKFFMIQLLAYIVENDNLRSEAKKQLEDVRSRASKENKENLEEVTPVIKKELKERLENIASNTSVRGQTYSDFEKKETREKNQISADLEEYAAPLKALCKAYSDYIAIRPYNASVEGEDKWNEIKQCWDIVGDKQKRLPRYILQEIFKDKRWENDPRFSLEPPRGDLYYWQWNSSASRKLFDLDQIGGGTFLGLCKERILGVPLYCSEQGATCENGESYRTSLAASSNSKALTRLYELRLKELEDIIDKLKTPMNAYNLKKLFISNTP